MSMAVRDRVAARKERTCQGGGESMKGAVIIAHQDVCKGTKFQLSKRQRSMGL